MAKGPDIEHEAHVCAHALQQGTWRLIRDAWYSRCVCCDGYGVYKKGSSGFLVGKPLACLDAGKPQSNEGRWRSAASDLSWPRSRSL